MDIEKLFQAYSIKTGTPIEELKQEYNEYLEEENKNHKDLTPDTRATQAIKRLASSLKKQLRSPAVVFEGVIVGCSDIIDMVGKKRAFANDLFKKDKLKAVSTGVTDELGTPLDNLKLYSSGKPNPKYGKSLPDHDYSKNIFGVVRLKDATGVSVPKKMHMNLRGEKAQIEIPLFTSITFKALNKTPEDSDDYVLSSSSLTEFSTTNITDMPKINDIITKFYQIKKISELQDYHQLFKDDFNRLSIIKADVSVINLEPSAYGNRLMILDDFDDEKSLETLEGSGLLCWIPQHINIDFGVGSKVIIFGRTGEISSKNPDGTLNEEKKDICINVYGIYVIPEFKVGAVEKKEIKAENLNFSAEKKSTEPEKEEEESGGW